MAPLRFSVDVLIERIPLASRWSDARWQPCALIVTGETPRDAGNARASGGPVSARVRDADDRWRCSGFVVELHPTESEGYWLNLSSDSPKAFVQWRVQDEADAGDGVAILPVAVTLSYHEAARWMDGGAEVETVPLPPLLRERMEAFVALHYKPEPRRKSSRNPLYEEHGPARRR